MSSGRKCKNCGSADIEVDPARGDAVCTNCGSVLEDNIIVAEVQFEENALGNNTAIGQFVSAESKGGATKFGDFHHGTGLESREITLRKAKNGITHLCNQLKLNQHCIDTACGFFKMALSRNLTRGRKNSHVHAACVYLTCRTEGTAHLLIDISDVLQICCYELGRTYLKLSQALCLNIPSVDPCLYILRFSSKLDFGSKTQQVANTALRLVQRMKRDSIHSGRRPSGLVGAALLMAARLHEFSRSTSDIVKIVKVHESTLRKRLIEFGDTPSSALTLEEFMTVDLEEEQDPPSFKAARKKDKERLQKILEEEPDSISDLQRQIEMQLEKESSRRKKFMKYAVPVDPEAKEVGKYIQESTIGAIEQLLNQDEDDPPPPEEERGLGPDISSMGLANSLEDTSNAVQPVESLEVDLTFDDIDDAELDAYIMTDHEAERKKTLWHSRNATYLEEQKIKAEKLQRERQEGKPEKKRKKATRRKAMAPASSAGEAIEKILQEKKISSKINYDVLKSLSTVPPRNEAVIEEVAPTTSESIKRRRLSSVSSFVEQPATPKPKKEASFGLPLVESAKEEPTVQPNMSEEEWDEDEEEDEQPNTERVEEMGVLQMLRQHREDDEEEGYSHYDAEEEY